MTRALRRRHRRAAGLLAIAVPAGIAAALAARPAPPMPAVLGIAALDAVPPARGRMLWEGRTGDAALGIRAQIGTASGSATPTTLDVAVRSDVGQPETLAYWSARDVNGGALPEDAILLGPVDTQRTQRLVLPAAARTTPGVLVLYRIAQGEVVAQLPLPALPAGAARERP